HSVQHLDARSASRGCDKSSPARPFHVTSAPLHRIEYPSQPNSAVHPAPSRFQLSACAPPCLRRTLRANSTEARAIAWRAAVLRPASSRDGYLVGFARTRNELAIQIG